MSKKECSYWDSVYTSHKYERGEIPTMCSTFAASIVDHLQPGCKMIEFGCGNGRDALFFATEERVEKVIGIDLSISAIAQLKASESSALEFVAADFTNLEADFLSKHSIEGLNVVYSRFTLHSVTKPQCSKALQWAHTNLVRDGMLFIEVRSVEDPIYGVGERVAEDRCLDFVSLSSVCSIG